VRCHEEVESTGNTGFTRIYSKIPEGFSGISYKSSGIPEYRKIFENTGEYLKIPEKCSRYTGNTLNIFRYFLVFSGIFPVYRKYSKYFPVFSGIFE
jgi:hypothetical protein